MSQEDIEAMIKEFEKYGLSQGDFSDFDKLVGKGSQN